MRSTHWWDRLPAVRTRSHAPSRRLRWAFWIALAVLVVVFALTTSAEEMIRPRMERALNTALKGYTVRLPEIRLHILGCSITLIDLDVRQNAHPNPPVAHIPSLHAGVDWRGLLRGRLVSSFQFGEPRLHINLAHFKSEVRDKTPLKDKGWQQALEEIYPFEINRFEVVGGELTYIDDDPKRPLKLEDWNFIAENIRNIRSPDDVYPSTVHLDAIVFDKGRLEMDGQANFLAEPYTAIDTDIKLNNVPLESLKPVADNANLRLTEGTLGVNGHVEYGPRIRRVELKRVGIDKLKLEYVTMPRTEQQEAARVEQVKEVARDISNEPATHLEIDELRVTDSEVAYVKADPLLRVFLSDTDVTVLRLSNQREPEPASVTVRGRFMGAGDSVVATTFRPVNKSPEFDLSIQIEPTPLRTMNEIFKVYGGFDVVAGSFALYSEIHARDGRLEGYVKPFFTDMDVYDSRQDREKAYLQQVYEGLVGAIATVLSPRDDLATSADISGRIDQPNVSTWDAVLGLVQNAFIRAIVRGFESEAQKPADAGQP